MQRSLEKINKRSDRNEKEYQKKNSQDFIPPVLRFIRGDYGGSVDYKLVMKILRFKLDKSEMNSFSMKPMVPLREKPRKVLSKHKRKPNKPGCFSCSNLE